jgi:hypothetical protein
MSDFIDSIISIRMVTTSVFLVRSVLDTAFLIPALFAPAFFGADAARPFLFLSSRAGGAWAAWYASLTEQMAEPLIMTLLVGHSCRLSATKYRYPFHAP